MARSMLGKSDRYYKNPILRDQEWDRAKQPPLWLMVLALAIVAVAFFVGVYADKPHNIGGWIVGVTTIVIYMILGSRRRRRARRELREAHGQTVT
jgi:hypothetical protein